MKNQSIETYTEMMMKLPNKNIKKWIINILYMFKKVEEAITTIGWLMEDIKTQVKL